MGRSSSLTGFLVLALLFLSFSHGFGRVLMEESLDETQFAATFEVGEGQTREMRMMSDDDYGKGESTGANFNSKGGPLPPNPSQPAPAPRSH